MVGCDGHGTINAHIIGGLRQRLQFPFADTNGYHYGLGVCPFVNSRLLRHFRTQHRGW